MTGLRDGHRSVSGRLSELPSFLGEGIAIGDQRFFHGLIRGQVVVFLFELPVEPVGRQRFIMHLILSVCNHWKCSLPGIATRGISVPQGFGNRITFEVDDSYLMWCVPHNLFSWQDFLFD